MKLSTTEYLDFDTTLLSTNNKEEVLRDYINEGEEITERDIETTRLYGQFRIETLEVVTEGDARDLEEVSILDPYA